MKNHQKVKFAILIAFCLVLVGVFYTQVNMTNKELDKVGKFVLVTSPKGEVAGEEISAIPRIVNLLISNGEKQQSYFVKINENSTVLSVLEKGAQENGIMLINTKSSAGTLVQSIQGVKNGTDNKYWIVYLNGQMLSVGVDKQTVKEGDKIEFKFEKSPF
jgi:hypothetical protein